MIRKIPTALESSTRADAAARRARGRQAENTKKRGWGEREWWRDLGCLFLLIV